MEARGPKVEFPRPGHEVAVAAAAGGRQNGF